MKGVSKKLIVALCLASVTFSAVACGGKDGGSNRLPSENGVIEDYNEHKVAGTVHYGLENIKDSGVPFVVDGKTDYKIVYDKANSAIGKAGDYIVSQINEATGATLTREDNPTWSADAKYVILGDEAMKAAANYQMTDVELGIAGYHIKTIGNSVFIYAENNDGYHLGALAFLRIVVGYDCLAADTIIYEKDGSYIPEMDVVERPDFDYRHDMTYYQNSVEKAYAQGISVNGSLMMDPSLDPITGSTKSMQVHNSFVYVDPIKYEFGHENCGLGYTDAECEAGHSNFFSAQRCNFRDANAAAYNNQYYQKYASQLCYTAHGNENDLKIMQTLSAERIVATALHEKNAAKNVITFTAQDESTECDCSSCKAIVSEYGNISAAIIMFMNGVDDIVQEKLQAYADETGTKKKEVNTLIFAYQQTRFAPKKIDEKTKMNEHVGVYLAASKVRYAHTFYDEINEADAKAIQDWSKFGKMYYWFYSLNAMTHFVPSNTFQTTVVNYRFAKENSGTWMGNNGTWLTKKLPGFTTFKEYLEASLMFDVNRDYAEMKETFFKHYYGNGGEYMLQFFNEVTAYMDSMRDSGTTVDFDGVVVNNNPHQAKYWPIQMVKRWDDLCKQALKAIESHKLEDEELYEKYRAHIQLEKLFPLFAFTNLHDDKFTQEELSALRLEFYQTCKYFDIKDLTDYEKIDTLWTAWGLE